MAQRLSRLANGQRTAGLVALLGAALFALVTVGAVDRAATSGDGPGAWVGPAFFGLSALLLLALGVAGWRRRLPRWFVRRG